MYLTCISQSTSVQSCSGRQAMLRLSVLTALLLCAPSYPPSHTQSRENVTQRHVAESLALLNKLSTNLQLLQIVNDSCSSSAVGNVTAFTMQDASGKLHSNMLDVLKSGMLQALGDYDECVDLGDDTARYCLFQGHDAAIYSNDTIKIVIASFRWGLCVPRQCNEVTLIHKVTSALKHFVHFNSNKTHVTCNATDIHYSTFTIVLIVIFSVIALLVLVATCIDYSKYYVDRTVCPLNSSESDNDSIEDDSLLTSVQTTCTCGRTVSGILFDLLQCFSLVRSVPKLFDTRGTSTNISCLHGIRTLSITWVILGHCSLMFFFVFKTVSNYGDVEKFYKEFMFQPIANYYYSVDSFFFLSGLLVMYVTMPQMGVKFGYFMCIKHYVHRIWRLTPPYAVALLFFWKLMRYVADGPLWMGLNDMYYKYCDDYWWTNLLYVNNFYPSFMENYFVEVSQHRITGTCIFDQHAKQLVFICMVWSWYLAADMQMYVLSLLFIVPAYFFGLLGLIPLAVALVVVLIIIAVIVTVHGFPANVMSPLSGEKNINYSNIVYPVFYTRAAPYIVGMALGYYLARRNSTQEKSFKVLSVPVWILAAGVGVAVVYGVYDFNLGHHYSQATSSLYLTFGSCMWGLCLAWVVYACVTGNGGVVDNILSWKGWFPFSRLTYCAYLLHPIVIIVYIGSMREIIHLDHLHMAYFFVGVTGITYGCAAILYLGIEYPAAAIEKVLLGTIGS